MLSVVTMLFCVWGYTQELPKIIPPSPEISSLGKYVDTPVNLAYGIPNISIPFFSIGTGKVKVPISLSYHASGVRVSEIASRVGLGWTLNAGGAISRSVRDIPDDYPNNGFLNTTNTVNSFLNKSVSEQATIVNPANGNIYDYQSDVYNFNFLGYSGKFFFNQDGTAISNPTNDLDINCIKNDQGIISYWVIKTPDGNSFYFGESKDGLREAKDTSTNASVSSFGSSQATTIPDPSSPMTDYTTSWKLMDIETTVGDLITFDYSFSNISFWNFIGDQREFNTGNGTSSSPYTAFYNYNMNDKTHRIKSINSNKGKIQFIYDTEDREDLDYDYSLKTIILKDNNDYTVDSYNLDYGYFITPGTHQGIGKENQCLKRLYLKEVTQEKLGKQNQHYTLEYNTDKLLPNRLSKSIDHWGYYNGKNNSVLHAPVNLYNLAVINGADRKAYEEYTKACVLKKITHPTGGITEFEFESNNVSNVSLLNLVSVKEDYIDGFNSYNMVGNQNEKIITLNNLKEYTYGISFKFRFTSECTNPNGFDCPKAEIYEFNKNTNEYELIHTSNGSNYDGKPLFKESVNYKIRLTNYSTDFGARNDINVSIVGRKPEVDSELGGKTGGLRVKKINKLDSNGNLLLQKQYSYKKFDNPTVTSGATLSPPAYLINTFSKNNIDSELFPVGLVKSNSIFPITNGSSYSSVYTDVTEINFNNNMGKTEYKYSYTHNGMGAMDKFNLYAYLTTNSGSASVVFFTGPEYLYNIPTGDYSHRRGNLINKKSYEYKNGNFSLIEEIKNTYSTLNIEKTLYSDNIVTGNTLYNVQGGYARYQNLSEPFYLKEKVKKTYSNDGIVEQKTTYTYDEGYNGRTFPIKTTTTNSKGEVLKTETKYAHDVNDTRLINEHRIAEPLEVKTYKEDDLLSWQKTVYDSLHNPSNLYLPKFIQTLKQDLNDINSLENRVVYHNYDTKGNPVEVSKKDGTHIVYIWGYNQTQPIAKIENAKLSDIPNTIKSEIETASNLDIDLTTENSLRVSLDKLRNDNLCPLLSNAQVTTFTYDPLIGVTSVTDPRGLTMYYEYDEFNRLEFIKDTDGNLLKEHKYNYKN